MTTSKIFYALKGTYWIQDASLASVMILLVKRQGKCFDRIFSGTPLGNQVLYTAVAGRLTVSIPFEGVIGTSGGPTDLPIYEPVFVMYKN